MSKLWYIWRNIYSNQSKWTTAIYYSINATEKYNVVFKRSQKITQGMPSCKVKQLKFEMYSFLIEVKFTKHN